MSDRNRKDVIIKAALAIITSDGAGKLSFDTLAERTGFTKSGILYHFPTKHALLQALVNYAYAPFFVLYARLVTDQQPHAGRTVLGYIRALNEGCGEGADTYAAVTAIVSEQPVLLDVHRNLYRTVRQDIIADGGDFAEQWAIIATLDGLWFDDMARLYSITSQERQQIVDHCLRQAHQLTGQPADVRL